MQDDQKWLPLRSSHIQRKKYFYFGIAERLRTLRYPIFTEKVVTANGIYSAAFSGAHSKSSHAKGTAALPFLFVVPRAGLCYTDTRQNEGVSENKEEVSIP